ncbi:MAG: hypothetical protein ABSE40_18545 [Candidatus Sulfotelmatobacter sp.]|jgi:hypothetical protein
MNEADWKKLWDDMVIWPDIPYGFICGQHERHNCPECSVRLFGVEWPEHDRETCPEAALEGRHRSSARGAQCRHREDIPARVYTTASR